MRVFGIDFTSAPRRGKPIACASAVLEADSLHVHCLAELESLEIFGNFLDSAGPWVAGLDFPFGQPRQLVEDLGWPTSWEHYVEQTERMGMQGFETMLQDYRDQRPVGQKHHHRRVDLEAGARSPMMMYRVPVGRMFQRGAPLLKHAHVSVIPCRPSEDDRVVVEAYPALIARRLIGRKSYKSDRKSDRAAELLENRRDLVERLSAQALLEEFGLKIVLDRAIRESLIEEMDADALDSVLCALQAAWAWTRRTEGWGVPQESDPLEGWIVDPGLVSAADVAAVRH